jgi:Flp pilus assembly pilin Flp
MMSLAPYRLIRQLLRARDGAAAVEMAVGVWVFLLAIFGVIEFGRLLWAQNALNYAVQQGARCMLVGACTTATAPTTASTVSGFNFPTATFTATTPSCGHQVAASYHFSFMTNLFTYPITLTATSCM